MKWEQQRLACHLRALEQDEDRMVHVGAILWLLEDDHNELTVNEREEGWRRFDTVRRRWR